MFWAMVSACAITVGILSATVGLQLALLPVTVVLAVLWWERPQILLLAGITCNLAANSGVPLVSQMRFLLLIMAALALVMKSGHQRMSSSAGEYFLFAAAVLVIADAGQGGGLDQGGGRALAFAVLLAIAILLPRSLTGEQVTRFWKGTLFVLAGYLAFGSLVKLVVDPGGLLQKGGFAGPFSNPNSLAIIAGALLVGGLVHTTSGRGRLSLVLLSVLVASGRSLGVLFACAAVTLSTRRRRLVGVLGLVAGLTVLLGVLQVTWYDSTRFQVWGAALREAAASPFAGVGFGNTEAVIREGRFHVPVGFQGETLHNAYVQALFELGLVPGLIFLLCLGAAIVSTLRTKASLPGSRAVVIFGLVSALSESWLTSSGSVFALIFWTAVGCTRAESPRIPSRQPAAVF